MIGITATYGNVAVPLAARNALAVLHLFGRDDVPVYPGVDHPIAPATLPKMRGTTPDERAQAYARWQNGGADGWQTDASWSPTPGSVAVHHSNGIGGAIIPDSPRAPEAPGSAVDFIITAAREYGPDLTMKSLIKSIVKEMQLDDKTYKPGVIQARISNAKNHLVFPDAYVSNAELYQYDLNAKVPATRDIYRRYWERCRQSDAMDFDDLLVYTYMLFRDHPEICRKYAEQFRYVLVDEYQDTNFAQHSIVLQLTQEHQRVCVVGDDAQSIYSFRGANIDNILKFTQLYKGAKLFKLEQNYRSTQTIVCAANSLIEKNSEQIRKEVFSEKAKGEPIGVFNAYSDVEEGEIVANQIVKLRSREHYSYNDFAILYRTNAQSRIFEEALRKRALPYKIYGGLSFYQRKEIKDVISYFRLAVNPNDEEAFKRVLNYPARGIGDTTLNKVIDAAAQHHVSLWMVLEEPLAYGLNINKGMHTKLQGFRDW